jgi:hypothetical protein
MPNSIDATLILPTAECEAAATWWAEHIHADTVPDHKVALFQRYLSFGMAVRNAGHWYPTKPERGSAYRSIVNDRKADPLLITAAKKAGIEEIGNLLPRAYMWIDPGSVRIRREQSKISESIFTGSRISFVVIFSIWVDIFSLHHEDDSYFERAFCAFGPLCSHARTGVPPVVWKDPLHGKGAFVNFVHFEDAMSALDACNKESPPFDGGKFVSPSALPVGNTAFILRMLASLSNHSPEIPYLHAEQLYESLVHALPNHWLDVLLRCPALFTARDEYRTIERRHPSSFSFSLSSSSCTEPQRLHRPARLPPACLPCACARETDTRMRFSAGAHCDPDAPRAPEEVASRAATPHRAGSRCPQSPAAVG